MDSSFSSLHQCSGVEVERSLSPSDVAEDGKVSAPLSSRWTTAESSPEPEQLGIFYTLPFKTDLSDVNTYLETMTKIRIFLDKSSARDKMLSFFQYSSLLCSDIPFEVLSAKQKLFIQFRKALSDGRKGFRLFKFLSEFEKGRLAVQKRNSYATKFFASILYFNSFMYYILDNWVFVETVLKKAGIKRSRVYGVEKLKNYRNYFSLIRTLLAICYCLEYIYKNNDDKNKQTKIWYQEVMLVRQFFNLAILLLMFNYLKHSNFKVGLCGIGSALIGVWKHIPKQFRP